MCVASCLGLHLATLSDSMADVVTKGLKLGATRKPGNTNHGVSCIIVPLTQRCLRLYGVHSLSQFQKQALSFSEVHLLEDVVSLLSCTEVVTGPSRTPCDHTFAGPDSLLSNSLTSFCGYIYLLTCS